MGGEGGRRVDRKNGRKNYGRRQGGRNKKEIRSRKGGGKNGRGIGKEEEKEDR